MKFYDLRMAGPYIRPTVDHLLEEEVDFELRLRKQTVDRRENLEDKKRLLRRLFKEDRKYNLSYESVSKYSDEIKTVARSVEEIVAQLRKKFDRNLVSRLRHFLIRVANASVENEEEAAARKEACEQIETVLIELNQHVREELEEKGSQDSGKKESGVSESWRNPDPNSAVKTKRGDIGAEDVKDRSQAVETNEQDTRYRPINPGALLKTPQKSIRSSFESLNFDKLELKCLGGDCKCGDCEGKGARKKDYKDVKPFREEVTTRGGKFGIDYEGKDEEVFSERGVFGNRFSKKDTQTERKERRQSFRSPEIRSVERQKGRYNDRLHSFACGGRSNSLEDVSSGEEFRRRQVDKADRRKEKRSESPLRKHRVNYEETGRERHGRSRNRNRYSCSESDSEYSSDISHRREGRHREKGRKNRRHRHHSSSSCSSSSNRRSYYKKSRVENWNLSFSGDNRSIQVEDFLYKIKKLAKHEGVSDKELLRNIHHRLKGEAYDWWFTREDKFTRWSKFEDEIRFRYGNPNRDRGIKAQIRELKQRKGETFIAYVTEVEKLNQCLQRPFSSSTLFELIWENMRPHYRSRLSIMDIYDLEHLIRINHKIDASDPNFYRTNNTGKNEVNHIEAEDSGEEDSDFDEAPVQTIQKSQRNNRQQAVSGTTSQRTSVGQPLDQRVSTTTLTCWNCQKNGHTWRDCKERRIIFCYACGKLGRTTRTCENNHPTMEERNVRISSRPTN